MKKLIWILLIVSGVVFQYNFANAEIKKDAGYISLSNSKTLELEPDKAQVSFSVETAAGDAQKAAKENNEISNKVIAALKSVINTQTDTVSTNNFSVRPNYIYTKSGGREIKNYTAVNSVTVDTKDIKRVAQIIDTAVSSGVSRTDNLSYSYESASSVCGNSYPQLIKELREQASAVAAASGSSLDGIKYINASCNSGVTAAGRRLFTAKSSLAAADNASEGTSETTPLEAGKVKITVNIKADFYVK